jgi:hypothetical protein
MYLLYRSTSFCIPAEKKLFGCSRSQVCNASFLPSLPNWKRICDRALPPSEDPHTNLSSTHGALSILSQHTTVNFHRFHTFCPKKPHNATFFDGAILQRRIHVFALVAGTRAKAERWRRQYCAMHQLLSVPVTA